MLIPVREILFEQLISSICNTSKRQILTTNIQQYINQRADKTWNRSIIACEQKDQNIKELWGAGG